MWCDAVNILNQIIDGNEYASLAFYNRACYQAVVEGSRIAEALESIMADLRRALEIRPDLKGLARRDPDLSDLNEWPEFQELIGQGD